MFFLKRLSPRTLFSLTPSSSSPSPYSYFIAQCSTSSSSHLNYSHAHSHPDSRNVRVSVWWDIDNCNVPSGVNVFSATQAITAAIKSSGIKGPIQITAFGDAVRLSRTNPEAYNSTLLNFPAFTFSHVPSGGDINAERFLFMDLLFSLSKNPPPAHLFLITVDGGSAFILNHLRLKNYNILLATKESAPAGLIGAATTMWNWDAMVRGENLTGRYFNPPHIWYGHYEGPLEDPFAEVERVEVLQQKHSKSKADEVFSQDSFWRDLQTFLNNTAIGSLIIAESRTRKKMAYYLQKYGPSVLKSVTKRDVLLMVETLILEKKWVPEPSSANSDSEDDDFSDSE